MVEISQIMTSCIVSLLIVLHYFITCSAALFRHQKNTHIPPTFTVYRSYQCIGGEFFFMFALISFEKLLGWVVIVNEISPFSRLIIMGLAMAQQLFAGLQISKSIERSCTWSMIQTNMHLLNPGCPRPSIALQCHFLVALQYAMIPYCMID